MRRDEAWLLDMLLHAQKARRYAAGVDLARFRQEEVLQLVAVRLIEVIGEAASRVSAEFQQAHPEIPWEDIVGMRHRLIHGYFQVHLDRVWEVLQRDLPVLIERLLPLVPTEGD